MTTGRLFWLVMGNICFNLGAIWLLFRWQVFRERAAYFDLCRDSRGFCQQVRQLDKASARREEVMS